MAGTDLAVLAVLLLAGPGEGLRPAELLDPRLDALACRPGERRLHVTGRVAGPRSAPIEPPLEGVLDDYLISRRTRLPHQRLGRRAALFVDARAAAATRDPYQPGIPITVG